MLETILKVDEKEKNLLSIDKLLNNVYLLPKWEKIKNVVLTKKWFIFSQKQMVASIYRKFSAKNNLEKYSIKDINGNKIASIDLRVYKDCVYIINLNIESGYDFEQIINILLQTAAEKALYNTTNKQLNINVTFKNHIKNKLKRLLVNEDFISEKNQSSYEKEMFGETYYLSVEKSKFWLKKISEMNILINK